MLSTVRNHLLNSYQLGSRFLLVRLHVEALASAAALSIKHVRNKLQNLPATLDDTYDEAMRRIQNQEVEHSNIAMKTLAWLTYAFRPLSLKELQHALAVEPGDTDLDPELIMEGHNITALCFGLVLIDLRSNMVNLVHYTTKLYLKGIRLSSFPGFHASITMSCATYLNLGMLREAQIAEMVEHYPLACYAAQYMGDHARQAPEEALELPVLETICQLLSHPDKRRPLLSLLDSLDLIRSGFYSVKKPAIPGQHDMMHKEAARSLADQPNSTDWDVNADIQPPSYEELMGNVKLYSYSNISISLT